jgi:hypothetical protein
MACKKIKEIHVGMMNLILDSVKSGEYKVDEQGIFINEDNNYLDIIKLELYDKTVDDLIDFYLVCYSNPGDEKPQVDYVDNVVGLENISVIENLYFEIHKRQENQGIEDKWYNYMINGLEEMKKNKN